MGNPSSSPKPQWFDHRRGVGGISCAVADCSSLRQRMRFAHCFVNIGAWCILSGGCASSRACVRVLCRLICCEQHDHWNDIHHDGRASGRASVHEKHGWAFMSFCQCVWLVLISMLCIDVRLVTEAALRGANITQPATLQAAMAALLIDIGTLPSSLPHGQYRIECAQVCVLCLCLWLGL